MAASEETLKRWTRIILICAIVVTLVALTIFAIYSLYINQNKGCGYKRHGPPTTANVWNSTYVLNNNTDYVLQQFNVNTTDFLRYQFCFGILINSSFGEKLEIINEEETILGIEYAEIGKNGYCTDINISNKKTYIGIRCATCSTTRNAVLQEVIAGDTAKQIINDGGIVSVDTNTTLIYSVFGEKTCKNSMRFFVWTYVFTIVGFMVMLLIIVGFNRFEKMLFEEWPEL